MKFEHAKRCPVSGLLNCRDLGGHPIPGGRIRWGQFYRSAAPMLPIDSRVLEDMGITLVIDLRSDFEHHKTLSFPASDTVSVVEMPVLDEVMDAVRDISDMGELYALILKKSTAQLGAVFTRMAENEGAVLFHCTAGKDRTGVVAALLLSLAGAARIDIVADYQISRTLIQPLVDHLKGKAHNLKMNALESKADFMRRMLDELEALGGAEAYLRSCGVSDAHISTLKAHLTECCPVTAKGMRRIALGKMENVRDLGGIASGDGFTQWGKFFRCAYPVNGMSEEERQGLLDMGITTVVDLRFKDEAAQKPNPLLGDPRFTVIQNGPEDYAHVEGGTDYPRIYCDYERLCAPHYKAVFEIFAHAPGGVIFHCASGKDRTGMVTGLLLSIASVNREDILSDYQVSSTYLDNPVAHPIPSNPENLISYLALNDWFGGVETFLVNRCGLSQADYNTIRDRLLGL